MNKYRKDRFLKTAKIFIENITEEVFDKDILDDPESYGLDEWLPGYLDDNAEQMHEKMWEMINERDLTAKITILETYLGKVRRAIEDEA